MTAAAALLRSVATKLTRAPQLHPRAPLGRGLHGTPPPSNKMTQQGMEGMAAANKSFTPPPTNNKDQVIEDLRRRLSNACAAAGIGAATLTGTAVYLYFWVIPDVEAHSKRIMSSGHGKHLSGATGKGTSMEELAEGIKDIRAKVEEQAALRKDQQAVFAKFKAEVESLRSKPERERV